MGGNLRNDIIWIGAVPDAIPGVRRGGEQLVREVFPRANGKTLSAAYFTQWKNTCDAKEANDRCYLLFSSKRSEPLDQCKATIGNLEGKDTVGNQLCAQARRFKKSGPIQNVELAFYSSTCGGGWTPVASDRAGRLVANERLCCDANDKYVKCDGGRVRSTC